MMFGRPYRHNALSSLWTAAALLICGFATPQTIKPPDMKSDRASDIIRFDRMNQLRYEPSKIKGDKALLFAYTLNGTSETWKLEVKDPLGSPVNPGRIDFVQYGDASHVWVGSELGRRLNGAALLNLKTKQVEKGFATSGLCEVSPDGRKLAYTLPSSVHDRFYAVLINKVAIYPMLKLTGQDDSPEKYLESDAPGLLPPGPECIRELLRHGPQYEERMMPGLGEPSVFACQGNDAFRFIVRETPAQKRVPTGVPGKFIECTATGLVQAFARKTVDIKAIKLTRRELSASEAEQRLKPLYENEYGPGAYERLVLMHEADNTKTK